MKIVITFVVSSIFFKLSGNLTEDRIKKSIKEIVGVFYNAAFFVVDDRSDLYESKRYSLIQSELSKRGITLVTTSRFETLSSSKVNVEDKFQDFMLSVQKNNEKILLKKIKKEIKEKD